VGGGRGGKSRLFRLRSKKLQSWGLRGGDERKRGILGPSRFTVGVGGLKREHPKFFMRKKKSQNNDRAWWDKWGGGKGGGMHATLLDWGEEKKGEGRDAWGLLYSFHGEGRTGKTNGNKKGN